MNPQAPHPRDESANNDRAWQHGACLAEVSKRLREESMRINAEFAEIERDPDA